jgi:hypothetical protein
METVPVVVFAHARPDLLRRTLNCLRANAVPLLYVFSDGPRSAGETPAVERVRHLLRTIHWCEVVPTLHTQNMGLGRSILAGVTRVLQHHPHALVLEDDLVCVPGTYQYLCAALHRYTDEPAVMSVTGWTHPSVTPANVTIAPYFDGRAESWLWGTWRRAWQGMDADALAHVQACLARGIDPDRYGADLLPMAQVEQESNIWAVRWLFHHMARGGLCLRPPHSLVQHIGFDHRASNAADGLQWTNPPLRACPPVPTIWPEPNENPLCAPLWRQAFGRRTRLRLSVQRKLRGAWRWLARRDGRRQPPDRAARGEPGLDGISDEP